MSFLIAVLWLIGAGVIAWLDPGWAVVLVYGIAGGFWIGRLRAEIGRFADDAKRDWTRRHGYRTGDRST